MCVCVFVWRHPNTQSSADSKMTFTLDQFPVKTWETISPQKCISDKLLPSGHRLVTGCCVNVGFWFFFFGGGGGIRTIDDKTSPTKTKEHLRYTNTHTSTFSACDIHSSNLETWSLHILGDGVGENGSHDFQMEGLELREPDQQLNSALGFHAEPNKVSQQRAEA